MKEYEEQFLDCTKLSTFPATALESDGACTNRLILQENWIWREGTDWYL